MRFLGYVVLMEERMGAHIVLVRKPEGKCHFKNLGVDGRIVLKWIFKRQDVSCVGRCCIIHLSTHDTSIHATGTCSI
jgi:hypothetical protein